MRRISPALRVAVVYFLVASVWILLSDRVVRWLVRDADAFSELSQFKGLGFVVVTSVALFVVIRRYVGRLDATNDRLRAAYDETLEGWAAALDIRDQSTAQHTHRVTELTVALAERLGFTDQELVHVRRGATLHDIGKMGVPDAILSKPGPLDDQEWVQMRRHPQLAVDMLARVDYLRPALTIPWCHHEKWDGSGYPRGLAGEDIPIEARLFAVVDVYDAVTSVRPYRRPMSADAALVLIAEGSGSHFDPAVVAEFLALMADARADS